MGKYVAYPAYKDSGVEWQGDVPEHWEVKRLKFFAQISNGQDQKQVVDDNGCFPIYGSGGIFGRSNEYLYDQPSVLLGRKGTIDKPLFVTEPFWTVDTMYYTRIYPITFPKLFFYQCLTIQFSMYQYGSALPSMTQESLNGVVFSSPAFDEQQQIADFLDDKTAHLDRLIGQKQQMIGLLNEKRMALITQAVTKGLDLNVPMKNSGVEWLGNVPEHWEVKRLKFFAQISNGQDQKQVVDDNGCFPIYGSGGIFGRSNEYLYDQPSVLLGRKGTIDKPLFVTEPFWTVDTMYYTKIYPITFPKFFFYQCLTIQFSMYQYGSALPSMTQESLNGVVFSSPAFDEQQQIAQYLDAETQKIDAMIKTVKQAIATLQEYRTALITAAVTGKIDVRDFKPANPLEG